MVEFTSVLVRDDSDVGEGEIYLKFSVNDLPAQFSGRLDVNDDEVKNTRPLKASFTLPREDDRPGRERGRDGKGETPPPPRRQVRIRVEGREDDSVGYGDPFRQDATHYDKLGVASVTINEGDRWRHGDNEVAADSGKFVVRYRLL